jgi:DNA (cytosine-5)-methyltransferase 1
LQSFDDDFVVLGSRTSQYLQVGNAVPPLLALAVGREVVKAFEANSPEGLARARARRAAPAGKEPAQRTLWDAAG